MDFFSTDIREPCREIIEVAEGGGEANDADMVGQVN
jgi:hypothetical protein